MVIVFLGLSGCAETAPLEPEPPPSQAVTDLADAPPELPEHDPTEPAHESVGGTAVLLEPLEAADPVEESIDWERARVCPEAPESNGCSPAGSKHCDCVGYLGLAPEGLFERSMEGGGGVVQRCVGLMSHLPCPEEKVAYSDCSAAVRAKGLSAAERVFFSCAARVCDGVY